MANIWLRFLLSRRYFITIAGDTIPQKTQSSSNANKHLKGNPKSNSDLGDNASDSPLNNNEALTSEGIKKPYIFIANYSSLINPLFLNLCLSMQNICYCMTKRQKQISLFLSNINKIIANPKLCHFTNPNQDLNKDIGIEQCSNQDVNIGQPQNIEQKTIINSQDENIQNKQDTKYFKARQNTVEQAIMALKAGNNLVIWTSDELQQDENGVINNCIAYEILNHLQEHNLTLPELFLVRIDGAWGSSFSRYNKNNIPTFFSTLYRKIHLLLLGPFLKKRPIQISFRQHTLKSSDLNSMERFNNLIKNWYTVSTKGALVVPNLCFSPNKYIPMSMPETFKQATPHNIISPKKLKIIEKTIHTQPEQYIDTFTPNPEEQRKQSQHIPLLAEIIPTVIRTPPLLPIQHAVTRQGTIIDTATATFSSRRVLLGLAKAISSILSELSASPNIGIALPVGLSSMAAFVAIFDCTLEENRLPVMLNYTLNSQDFEQCIHIANIKYIITTKTFSNLILPPNVMPIYIEDISQTQITKGEVASFIGFAGNTNIDLPAVMLFNKDKGIIKAFTLTHRNLVSCLGDIIHLCATAPINAHNFSLLCSLPIYTSLGLLNNIIMPLTCGIPVVTVPHTQDINQLTRIAEKYNTNLYIGTSSNLEQILKTALVHLPFRYAIVHTNSDMSYIYRHFSQICPNAILMQAYSVNECSSIISLNTRQHPDSIGKILPNLNYSINDEKLYVRGESIFSGYLNDDDPRTNLNDSSIHQDWLCLNSKFKVDDEGFLYHIEFK